MFFDDLNSTIFTLSLFVGFALWLIVKMASNPAITDESKIDNKLMDWWTVRKIKKWKIRNKISNQNDDTLDNSHTRFYGCSQEQETIFIEFKKCGDFHDANFTLTLKDGTFLTIPDFIATDHTTTGPHGLSCRGLTIEPLLHFSKWRITFNGLIDVKRLGEENNNTEPQHVIFTFFWFAASDPLNCPDNWSSNLLARAFGNDPECHLNELLKSDRGFDQIGSLFGQVIIYNGETKETHELNLPGLRQSRQLATTECDKTWSLAATCMDGFVLSLSARDIDKKMKIFSGCVRMPNMEVYNIDDSDLNISNCTSEVTRAIVFTINANNRTFKGEIRIIINNSRGFQCSEFSMTQTPFSIEMNGQAGCGLIVSSTKIPSTTSSIRATLTESKRELLKSRNVFKTDTLTLFFNEPDAQCEQLCGGKGSSLAFLTQLTNDEFNGQSTFLVPQGFILTTNAFDMQIKHNRLLRDAITNVENIAYNRSVGMTLDNACEQVSKLFIDIPITNEIADSIKRSYSMLRNNTASSLKVAVRSSAVGEDGAASSSAGQNETFLGIQNIDQVIVAIQKCWASLFTAQSVTYRVQNIQPINTKMSVVIQTMVAPDCAGVLFTQHPVTKDPSKLLITANYGLGESVVSGLADPDMFVIQRSYRNNNLNVLERKLGEKTTCVQMLDDEVNSSKVQDEKRNQLCIDDQHLLKLCEIGINLQLEYGSPRDIEWAILKDKIYLLQSRPMTAVTSFTSWELMHEFDTAVMSSQDCFTFGNIGEVMSQTVTPLTISVLIPSFESGLLKNFPIASETKYFNQLMNVSHSRVSMNVFNVFMRMVKQEISMENRIHGIAIFGHEFVTDEMHDIATHRFGRTSKLTELWYAWTALRNGWKAKATVDELNKFMEKFIGTYNRRNLRIFRSLKELYDDVTVKINDNFSYVQSVHGLSTAMTTIYQIIMFSSLAEGSKKLSTEHLKDITVLLSSCENAESAEIPILLEEIASALLRCNSSKAHEFCDITPDKAIAWLTENCITAYTLFELFIERHAHRGFQEFDFGYETWGMNPTLVIEMLQKTIRNRKSGDSKKKRPIKRTHEEILTELKTPTKGSTRRILRFFLPRCQNFVELRERTKSQLIAYIHELRKAYCYMAEKMQKEGLLPDMDLIFYLTHQEIGTIIDDRRRSELISKAIRRRRLFPEWRKLQFEEFHWGLIKPINAEENVESNHLQAVGTPVCEGKITGRACIVKTFSEVSKLKAGDILITYCTDIAWSPYFPMLGGVVTELGGLISHGAVVAREYGLPCIVGAKNATKIITDGEEIIMDAYTGVIMRAA